MDSQQVLSALTGELVTAQDQLLALYELSNLMRRQENLEAALQALARLTCLTLDSQKCVVKLAVPGRGTRRVCYPDLESEPAGLEIGFDREPDSERWSIRDNAEGKDNLLLLPLKFEVSNAGSLVCLRTNGKPFGSPDGKLGQALANQAAAFLENIVLNELRLENAEFKAEMRIANDVQTSLLPKALPVVKGVDIWGASKPAKHVGGDFYDVQVQPDGLLFFCVGDVTGKGMPAALIMAMLLMLLRSEQRASRYSGPAELMDFLNRAAYDELTASGMFATLFLGSFDPSTRLLKFVNAGHSPVIIRPHDSAAMVLEANNIPVGVFPEMEAEEEELVLNEGDFLIVASDGLNEARNVDGELFSIERISELIGQSEELQAAQLGKALISAVSEFSLGSPQNDDQTCLIFKGVGQV